MMWQHGPRGARLTGVESAASSDEEAVVLFRPVGQKELELIRAAGFTAFPPRLPGQPIFYPVLNEEYAVEIARDWNTKDPASGFAGYVTRFQVRRAFLARYEVRTVGIPAEEQEEMHRNLVGTIEVVAEFHPPPPSAPGWALYRQDDHGSRFLVERFAAREEAEAARSAFESRGHKQLYWVEAVPAGSGPPPGLQS